MPTSATPPETEPRSSQAAALDDVIRTFSNAEVALREITGEAQRIKSATQVLEASRGSLAQSTAELRTLAERLGELATAMAESSKQAQALDPDRLWATVTETRELVKADGAEAAKRSTSLTATLDDVRHQVVIVRWLAMLALITSIGAIVAAVALANR